MGNGNPFEDDSLTNHPSVQAPPANGNPFADESLTAEDTQQTEKNATITAPSVAGHMPGFMDFGNRVTPAQAAGGVAAGVVAGAAPLALSAIPNIGEALLTHAEEHAAEWAAKYPHLVALGAKIGIPTAATAFLGWMIHQAKSK